MLTQWRSVPPDWMFPGEVLLARDGSEWRVCDRTTGTALALTVEHADTDELEFTLSEPVPFRVANFMAELFGVETGWNAELYFNHGDTTEINGKTLAVLVNGQELSRRLEAEVTTSDRQLREALEREALQSPR